MNTVTREYLKKVSATRRNDDIPDFSGVSFEGLDLSGLDLRNMNFTNADFRGAKLTGANLRGSNLSFADIRGANLFSANLEHTVLEGIRHDKETSFFDMQCPIKGAFVGYKKCFNNRMVMLLIPADAKRSSATNRACRCNKAKVLSIKSLDDRQSFEEATSFVDDNFVYRVGHIAEVKDYNEDRWMDSTTGIHFFLTRAEAAGYM